MDTNDYNERVYVLGVCPTRNAQQPRTQINVNGENRTLGSVSTVNLVYIGASLVRLCITLFVSSWVKWNWVPIVARFIFPFPVIVTLRPPSPPQPTILRTEEL